MRYTVTLYRAKEKGLGEEKVLDLTTHTSEVNAEAKTHAVNNALGIKTDIDGWFCAQEGQLFAMYE